MFVFPLLYLFFSFVGLKIRMCSLKLGAFSSANERDLYENFHFFAYIFFALIAFVLPRPNSVFKYFSTKLALTFPFYLLFYSCPENASVNSHIKTKLKDTQTYMLLFFCFEIFFIENWLSKNLHYNNFHRLIT